MDRVWLEEFLAEQAVAAGAGGDLGWLGVVERVSDPVVSWGGVGGEHWGGGFGGGGGLPSWSDVLGSRQLARGFSLVTAPSGGVSDVSFGVSGEVGAPVVGPPAWFLELLDRVSSQEFQSWMEPFEGPSRAVGGVIGGVNPLRAAAFGGLTAAEALVERGVDPRLALGLELAFVPDPTFASRAADLLPLMGFIGTGLRNLQFSGELTDFVSPDLLRSARGNLLRRDEGEMAQLSREIMSNPEGVAEPIKILYDPVEMVWWVGEGNHRAVVASKAGVPGVPVTVLRGRSSEGRGALKQPIPPEGQAFLRAMEEQRHGYVPGNLSPSQLGLPVADRSAVSDWVVGHARSLGLSGESVDDILDQVARTYELNRDWGITMPTLTPARQTEIPGEFTSQLEDATTAAIDRIRNVFDVTSLPSQAATSARTSIRQVRGDVASAPAVFTWLERNRPLEPGSINLDIGGGRYDDTSAFVADKFNAQSFVYDPYNRTPEHNAAVIDEIINAGGADTVTVSNVLNVISDEAAQLRVIEQAREGLKDNGEAFFTVYQGDGSGVGRMTGADTYQANKKTREYLPLIKRIFGEENVTIRGNVIIARKPTVDITDLANLIDTFE